MVNVLQTQHGVSNARVIGLVRARYRVRIREKLAFDALALAALARWVAIWMMIAAILLIFRR